MAENIIERIIRLVLERESVKAVEHEMESSTDRMSEKWKQFGEKVAEYVAIAFAIEKIHEFGKEAIAAASKSEATWLALKNTIDNTGASFDKMEENIRHTSEAFKDATVYDDDAFAEALNRMIALTGDTKASLNNMGLVANVAAKYFRGELEPAANLVSKAMNGNVTMLHKLGISAKDAQDALNILSQRSMGAASREADTYGGKIKQLGNDYDDMLKALGFAIIGSDGAADSFSVLKAAIKTLTEWIEANKETVSKWVTEGVKFAIDAADVFIRAVSGMANILQGGFRAAIGLASVAVSTLEDGLVSMREVLDKVQAALHLGDPAKAKAETDAMREQAKALAEWGNEAIRLGGENVQKGLDRLSTPLFSSADFTGKGKKKTALPGETSAPMVGKNAATDATKEVEKALKEYEKSVKSAAAMQDLLGDKFDAVGADLTRTQKLYEALTSVGVDPATVGFKDLGEHLTTLINTTVPLDKVTRDLTKSLSTGLAMSAITSVESINQLQSRMDMLKAQQGDVLKSIQTLLTEGFDPMDQSVQDLTEHYHNLGDRIKEADVELTIHELSKTLSDEFYMAALDGASAMDRLNMEHGALQKAIQDLLAKGVSKEDAALKALIARYGQVTDAIKQQTIAMQLQAATADFLADALGTALQGGLHEAAAAKAKENAIQAAEMLVRAGAFALFGDWPHAQGALLLAGQFAAVATAWGGLALSSHGSAPISVGAGGASAVAGSTGSDLTSGRSSTSSAASSAKDPTADVSIYLVGPGFDAMNPQVQKVVRGAYQNAAERYGNARIRTVTSES